MDTSNLEFSSTQLSTQLVHTTHTLFGDDLANITQRQDSDEQEKESHEYDHFGWTKIDGL